MCGAGVGAGVTALNRFLEAQNRSDGAFTTYDAALAELRAGRKTSHWMWFVFPQLAGVAEWYGASSSATARHFAIVARAEAEDFASHPILGQRLIAAFDAAMASGEADPVLLMGGIDAAKLKSSATLFAECDLTRAAAANALTTFFANETCAATIAILAGERPL